MESHEFSATDEAAQIFSKLVMGMLKEKANSYTLKATNIPIARLYRDANHVLKEGFNPRANNLSRLNYIDSP